MNKQKIMELLSEAIDKKANFTIYFGQFHKDDYTPVTGEEAFDLAHRFMDALHAPGIKQETGTVAKRYVVEHECFNVGMSYIPSESEELETKRQQIEHLKRELAKLENEGVAL